MYVYIYIYILYALCDFIQYLLYIPIQYNVYITIKNIIIAIIYLNLNLKCKHIGYTQSMHYTYVYNIYECYICICSACIVMVNKLQLAILSEQLYIIRMIICDYNILLLLF